jgi:hypothetical protein
MITWPSLRQSPAPPASSPYTAAPASASVAKIAPAIVAPATRRNGDCAGSVSRMTSAATTRCTENWYECS